MCLRIDRLFLRFVDVGQCVIEESDSFASFLIIQIPFHHNIITTSSPTSSQQSSFPPQFPALLFNVFPIVLYCLPPSLIINSINFMSEIKKHRRNKAVQASDEPFRQSIPYAQLQTMRKSIGLTYESPKTFRFSDMGTLPLRESFAAKHLKPTQATQPEGNREKQTSNLRTTLQDLELKLKKAKKMLQNRPSEADIFGKQFSEAINASNGSDNFWEKLQESTINLESQKKLISVIKSKEKIVCASKIKQYYLSSVAKGVVGINQRALQHLQVSLEVLRSFSIADLPNQQQLPRNKVILPQSPRYQGKKTLILDLDETLFHCDLERNTQDDIEVDISDNNTKQKGYVSIRPYALSFLKRAAQHFQVISFTASERSYADTILDQIDFQNKLISHRLYRQHCVRLQGKVYAKDISIINRPLSQMVIVDNSPISYLYQRDNGIPILPYTGGEDSELLALEKYLDLLKKQSDVRLLNRRTFKLHRYGEFKECEELVRELYQDKEYY